MCNWAGSPGVHSAYSYSDLDLEVHLYVHSQTSYVEDLYTDESNQTALHLSVPSASLEGLWGSLIYENNVQYKLLKYIQTSLIFAGKLFICFIE